MTRSARIAVALALAAAGCGPSKPAAKPVASGARAPVIPAELAACVHPDAADWLTSSTDAQRDRAERYDLATTWFRDLSPTSLGEAAAFARASHTLLLFRGIALEPADDDLGVDASQLYFEALNALLIGRPERRELCLLAGRNDIDALSARQCADDAAGTDCARLARMRCALDGKPIKECSTPTTR